MMPGPLMSVSIYSSSLLMESRGAGFSRSDHFDHFKFCSGDCDSRSIDKPRDAPWTFEDARSSPSICHTLALPVLLRAAS